VIVVAPIVVAGVVFLMGGGAAPQRVAIADLEDPASPMAGETVTVEGEVDEVPVMASSVSPRPPERRAAARHRPGDRCRRWRHAR